MKTKLLPLLVIFLLSFSACQKETDLIPNGKRTPMPKKDVSFYSERMEPTCESIFDLMAGQHFLAGQVFVQNDADSVYVGYITNGWSIAQTHLYIGDCEGIPVSGNGSPVPGHFPVSSSFSLGVSEVWYSFPLSSLPVCGCIVAHAVVQNNTTGKTETGWAQGARFTDRSWGMYNNYCLCTRQSI